MLPHLSSTGKAFLQFMREKLVIPISEPSIDQFAATSCRPPTITSCGCTVNRVYDALSTHLNPGQQKSFPPPAVLFLAIDPLLIGQYETQSLEFFLMLHQHLSTVFDLEKAYTSM